MQRRTIKRRIHRTPVRLSQDSKTPLPEQQPNQDYKLSILLTIYTVFTLIRYIVVSTYSDGYHYDNPLFENHPKDKNQRIILDHSSHELALSRLNHFHQESFSSEDQAKRRKLLQNHKGKCRLKIGVFLQVGYADLWEDMLTCTANVASAVLLRGCQDIDVLASVVDAKDPTGVNSNSKKVTTETMLSTIKTDLGGLHNVDDIIVQQFQNKGADIGSFLQMLSVKDVATRSYDIILKMHTKGDAIWRERGIESLCGTPEQVVSIINHYQQEDYLDMVAPQGTVFGPETSPDRIFPHIVRKYNFDQPGSPPKVAFDQWTQDKINEIHKYLSIENNARGIKNIKTEDMVIAAGSMFWVQYKALNPPRLVELFQTFESQFSSHYVENLSLEHVLERVFPTEIVSRTRLVAEIPPAPRSVALYFPQFHPIPENDKFWGKGFTEWTLLKPLKLEDIRKPLETKKGGLGYYDLMSTEARKKQADLAKRFGVNGFIYYHYWFNGDNAPDSHKVMYQVVEQMLLDGEPNLPFAFSWANEPWTKSWTGVKGKEENLINQEYGNEDDWKEHFEYLLPFFKHKNYIRVDGKPVFILYRIGHIDSKLKPMLDLWNILAYDANLAGIHFVNTIGNFRDIDIRTPMLEQEAQIDAAFHFWPQLFSKKITLNTINGFSGSTQDIAELTGTYTTQYWGSFTGFDRRPRDASSTPTMRTVDQFGIGLKCSFNGMAYDNKREIGKNLYFITAWNEWNEQAVLEPDTLNGFGYLEKLQENLLEMPISIAAPSIFSEEDEKNRESNLKLCGDMKTNLGKSAEFSESENATPFPKVSIVINYCNHDMDWYYEFTKDIEIYNTTVVSKCDGSHGIPENASLLKLPNVGRNDYTFAWFMENMEKRESLMHDEVVVFLKDNLNSRHKYEMHMKQRKLEELVRDAWENGFSCHGVTPYKFHSTEILKTFGLFYYKVEDVEKSEFKSIYKNFGNWLSDMNIELPSPLTQVCYGGIFAVKRSLIERVPKEMFKNIRSSLSRGDNIEEGHFAERTWAGILSHPPSQHQEEEIMSHYHYIIYEPSTKGALVTMSDKL